MLYYQIIVFPVCDVHFSLIISMCQSLIRIDVFLVFLVILKSNSVKLVSRSHLRRYDFKLFVYVGVIATHVDSLVPHLYLNNSV